MQKTTYLLFIIATIFLVTACTKTDLTFGNQYLDNSNTQVISIDTFGVKVSSIYTDSFITSGKGVSLVGGYTDPLFGKINAQTFFEIAPPTYTDTYQYTKFDSINLILKVKSGNYYGDSTQSLHIDVNKLTANIVPFDNVYNLYNIDKFNFNATPLGSKDIVVRPMQTDTISIRLTDALGLQLFGMLQRGSDTIKTASVFLDFFKGLRIGGGNSNKMILGCTDSVKLRINYKQSGTFLTNLKVDFNLSNNSHHFTNVTADRSGTPIALLGPAVHELNSTVTNNAGYTQSATGISAKIVFPSIRDIVKLPTFEKVLKAVLVIRPIKSTFSSFYYLPPQLRLSVSNQLNQLGPDLSIASSNGSPVTQFGNLQIDYTYGENTYYSYDVTNYVKGLLNDPTVNINNGLLLSPPSTNYETNLSRVVIGNKNNITNSSISLQVFYVAIQ